MTAFSRAVCRSVLWLTLGLGVLTQPAIAETQFMERDGGPSHAQMLVRGDAGIAGLARVRPVLAGVLYRAGFQAGDKGHTGLSETQREALCQAGFSGVRYIDFGSKTRFGTTNCGTNQLDYEAATSNNPRDVMRAIYQVIEHPDRGPILVHCMWGVHSSGAVSAMALMQFCGWDKARAKAYWDEARNDAPCGGAGCDQWIDGKLDHFKIDPGLRISAEQQRQICPH